MVDVIQLKSPRGSAGIIVPNDEVRNFLSNYPWYLLGSKWGQSDAADVQSSGNDDDDEDAEEDNPVIINFMDGYEGGNFKPKIYILDNQIVMFWVPKPIRERAVLRDPNKGRGYWDPVRYSPDNVIRYDRDWSQGAGTWWFFHRSANAVVDSTGQEYYPLVPGIPVKVSKINGEDVNYEGVLETWTGAQLFRRFVADSSIEWAAPLGLDLNMNAQGGRLVGSNGFPRFNTYEFDLKTTFPQFSTWANKPTPKNRELRYNKVALQFWGAEIKQEKKTLQNITSFMDGQTIQFKIPLPKQKIENSYISGKNPDTGQNINGRVNQILPNWQQNLNLSFKNMTDAETGESPEFNALQFENGLQTNAGRGNRTFPTFSADVEFNSDAALPIFNGTAKKPNHTTPWSGRGGLFSTNLGFLINFVRLAPRLFRN
tara:strand:+ start:9310 stop:10590 length:1281 start_codon:yes stop_codon:yes gene_type:complete